MTGMGGGAGGQWIAALSLLAAVLYVVGATRLLSRGDVWPARRRLSFVSGCVVLGVAAVAPLPGAPFTAHMVRHLLLGMIAPVLLVVGRPGTLLLRAVSGTARRMLARAARSVPAAAAMLPPVAAAFDVGGLWLLYRTPLFAATQTRPWLATVLQLHVLTWGLLFTAAVCQLDPVPHRYGLGLRAGTLVAAGGAHSVLAKILWAAAPPHTWVQVGDLHLGAQVMYYGGDAIEIALAAVIAGQWYAAGGRELRRLRRRAAVTVATREAAS